MLFTFLETGADCTEKMRIIQMYDIRFCGKTQIDPIMIAWQLICMSLCGQQARLQAHNRRGLHG